jgi:hypothetical protein
LEEERRFAHGMTYDVDKNSILMLSLSKHATRDSSFDTLRMRMVL